MIQDQAAFSAVSRIPQSLHIQPVTGTVSDGLCQAAVLYSLISGQ